MAEGTIADRPVARAQPARPSWARIGFGALVTIAVGLSLFPFSAAWMGENHLAATPTAAYGVVLLMAGGLGALVRSVEGAEDSEADGARATTEAGIGKNDVVIGIAASGTTPYTIGALRAADSVGSVTIAIAANPGAPLLAVARHRILVDNPQRLYWS